MSEQDTTTNEPEVKEVQPEAPTEQKEQTVAELNEQAEPESKPETVGLDKFLDEKKARKALEKEVATLREQIKQGGSKEDLADGLAELAEEYPDVDPKFLSKLSKSLKDEAKKELDAKLKPLEERERAEKLNTAFNKAYNEVIGRMPEYAGIVNPEVIKALTLDGRNSNKTLSQLIEDTYGNAITGRRSIETTTPAGGKEPEKVDKDRMTNDPKYYDEVMKNPTLKKEYNEDLINRVSRYL